MNMESESKIKVKEGLENPKVGRDLKADQTSDQPTNGNDQVLSADPRTQTKRNGASYEISHCNDEISELNVVNLATAGSSDDTITSEETKPNEEYQQSDVTSGTTNLPETECIITSPEEAIEPADESMKTKISQCTDEISQLNMVNFATAGSSDVTSGTTNLPETECVVMSPEEPADVSMERDTAVTSPEEAIEPADASMEIDISQCKDAVSALNVAKSATIESSDDTIFPEKTNPNEDCQHSVVSDVTSGGTNLPETESIVAPPEEAIKPSDVSMKTDIFQCKDEISELNLVNLATTESSDGTILLEETNPNEELHHLVVIDVTSNLSDTECVVTSHDAAVLPAEVPMKTEVSPYLQEEITVPNSPDSATPESSDLKSHTMPKNPTLKKESDNSNVDEVISGTEELKLLDTDLTNFRHSSSDSETQSEFPPNGTHYREAQDISRSEQKDPLLVDHNYFQPSELRNEPKSETPGQKEPGTSDNTSRLPLEQIISIRESCSSNLSSANIASLSMYTADEVEHESLKETCATGLSSSATLLQSKSPGHVPQVATNANPVNEETVDSTREKVLDKSPSETTEISKLSLNQLKKYYKWRILGIDSSEAIVKAKEPGLVPQTEDPHTDCKLPWEEIKEISLLLPPKHPRTKFQVETFFGGKDPEEQLKRMLSNSNTERHPDCVYSWEALKKMSKELPKESLRLKFVVETYCRGKKPDEFLQTMLPSTKSRPFTNQMAKDSVGEQNVSGATQQKLSVEPETSKLSLNQLKKYHKWCILGLDSSEALVKAKDIGLVPQTEGPHPNCILPFEEIKEISLLIPAKRQRNKYVIETFFGGKDAEEQLRLTLSSDNNERHPDCKQTWEDLKTMSDKLPKESMKLKFIAKVFYEGSKPEDALKTMLPSSRPTTSNKTVPHSVIEQNVCGSTSGNSSEESIFESEITKLSLNQLKKYYKWRILGADSSEAIVKAKEPGLIPQTENPHPNCKLPWEEIKQISLLIPAKHPRSKFQVETYFGGKKPDEQLKIMLSNSNTKRHPDCTHSWDDLMKMSNKLPQEFTRSKFVVETFFGGKEPADLLKTMLSNNPNVADNIGDICFVDGSVKEAAGAKDLDSACGAIAVIANRTIIEEGAIGDLPNGQLKYFYLWSNGGFDNDYALSKARKFENYTGKHLPHPECKLSQEELKKMSQALSFDTISRDRFLIHTYFGGKDPECTLRYFKSRYGKADEPEDVSAEKVRSDMDRNIIDDPKLANGKLKYYYLWCNKGYDHETALSKVRIRERFPGTHSPHPNCQYTKDQLLLISQRSSLDTISRDRFLIHTYFGGKDPECTLRYFKSRSGKTGEPEDVPAKKPEGVSAEEVRSDLDRNHAIIEGVNLANGKLKYYYLWRNEGYDHETALSKVRIRESFPGTHYPHPNCRYTKDQLKQISNVLESENTHFWDRFLILTYYGGKDPESTLQYFMSRLGKSYKPGAALAPQPEDISAKKPEDIFAKKSEDVPAKKPEDVSAKKPEDLPAEKLGNDLDRNYAIIDNVNLANGKLKYYYLWRNEGYDHKTALSKVRIRESFPGTHYPHPNCQYTKDQLNQMSNVLESENTHFWDRFLILTYYGGKDPESTLQYFMSRLGKSYKPGAALAPQPEDISAKKPEDISAKKSEDVPAKKPEDVSAKKPEDLPAEKLGNDLDRNYAIIDDVNLANGKLKYYYLWRNEGYDHKTALSKVRIRESFPGTHYPHPNCQYTKDQLKQMSNVLESENTHFWDRFLILAYYGGKDPESTLQHFKSRRGKAYKPEAVLAVHSVEHITVLDTTIVNNNNLKSYYLWRNRGLKHKTALSKIANQETMNVKSRNVPHHKCKHSQDQLRYISQALKSNPYVWDRFLIHTYYGGEDPEDTLRYYMTQSKKEDESKDIVAGNPQQARKIPGSARPLPSEPVAKRARSFPDPGIIPLDSPNHPSRELDDRKLVYYYTWISHGCSREEAMTKAKTPGMIPKRMTSRCSIPLEELKNMSKKLPRENLRRAFIIETYYAGNDPEEIMKFLLPHTLQKSEASSQLPETPLSEEYKPPHGPSQAAGLPGVESPYQHPAVSLPQAVMLAYQQPAVLLPHASLPSYQNETASLPTTAYPHCYPSFATTCMVYPPNQLQPDVTAGAVVYPPHQQPVPGPSDIVYPPNQPQTTLPDMLRSPPQASMAYSGYHYAAVVPTTVAYPPNQPQVTVRPPLPQEPPPPPPPPPPPHVNSTRENNMNATAQSLVANQPLVGKHDSIQSSFKRKATDEFPIKIKLQSTSELPAQPKKTRKEEKPPEKDGSAPMFIVPTSYPTECLTESQMDAIESTLLEAILEMDDDGTKPSFTDSCRSNGQYGITCVDHFSVNWLHKFLSTYQPWPGASLKLISKQGKMIRANAILPSSKNDDDKKILKFIERQNKGLNANMWTVIQRWDNGDFNTCMDLVIDEDSSEVLQKCSRISFKLGSAEIITAENDSPPVSRLGHQTIADSSQTQAPMTSRLPLPSGPPLRSSPPTPKCMRPGEGYPSRPKRPGKTDGSPLRSSACSVPSQDRFGSPVSKTHPCKPPLQEHSHSGPSSTSPDEAGEGKHSWLDWFYSKEELGVTRKHESRSPSRGSSSSPDTSRKTKRTRRNRRRSDSMSLSPECSRPGLRTPSPDRYGGKSSYSKEQKRTASRSPSSSRHRNVDSRQREKYSRYH